MNTANSVPGHHNIQLLANRNLKKAKNDLSELNTFTEIVIAKISYIRNKSSCNTGALPDWFMDHTMPLIPDKYLSIFNKYYTEEVKSLFIKTAIEAEYGIISYGNMERISKHSCMERLYKRVTTLSIIAKVDASIWRTFIETQTKESQT